MFLTKLPTPLEDVESLKRRREAAKTRKDMWRSTYQEAQQFAMPARETFTWTTEGQVKNNVLYDSTLQEATYAAANTMCALLFPNWQRWMELAPGGAIDPKKVTAKMVEGFQQATATFFAFLNHSNFQQTIGEVALDLMIGTGALSFDEGETDDQPFQFTAIPLPVLELEEGPDGTIESTFICRKIKARDLMRVYPGLNMVDLSSSLADKVASKPDEEVEVIQCELYYPKDKNYYGVVVDTASNHIMWRFNYGHTCPTIVARATKVAGETYGRGRVLLALSDAKTLDKMREFVLRHSAMQIAPPMTGVTDGVLNPYTARLFPNTILPVGSNESGNPSLRVMDVGGNFQIGERMMQELSERIRRTLLGPDMSEGAIKSATEISVADRNRLWTMNGEYNRIMAELIEKIVARGMFILAKRGLVPEFKIDGRVASITYTSPFARSQNSQDIIALQTTTQGLMGLDPTGQQNLIGLALRVEDAGEWIAKKTGLDMALVRDEAERKAQAEQRAEMMRQAQAAEAAKTQPPAGG